MPQFDPKRCYVPTEREIAELIAAAAAHPLGIEFLRDGELCAVATMFRVHPFTVDAARERFRAEGASTIMLGDTTGVANPVLVRQRVAELPRSSTANRRPRKSQAR